MLTCEVKINGRLIVHLYAVNLSGVDNENCIYRWEAYRPDGYLLKGQLMHKREEGALRLVERLAHEALCEKRFQESDAKGGDGEDSDRPDA